MKSLRVRTAGRAAGVAIALIGASGLVPVQAQTFPARPIRIVVPFPAGGPSDYAARVISQRLPESLGQQVIVDNRPGGAGAVGAEIVARAPADGYMLLIANVGMLSVSPHLIAKLPYDTLRDFAPITNVIGGPSYLVVHPSLPVKNVKDLVALAKQRPGELAYGSAGAGQISHMNGELFRILAGVNLLHVPYKGTAPILPELIGGQTALTFSTAIEVIQFAKQGRVRLIAVTGKQRSPAAPETPTVDESGVPGFEALNWNGIVGPAGLPRDIVNRLNRDIVRALGIAEVKERIAQQGNYPIADTPEQFTAYIKLEYDKWARVVKQAGIKPD